jgi:hypothetical protein
MSFESDRTLIPSDPGLCKNCHHARRIESVCEVSAPSGFGLQRLSAEVVALS